MDQDDDVERLFSWLQTPEIRYREFAGAREVTDTVATWQLRTNTPNIPPPAPHNALLNEEYPPDQFPDQSQVNVEVVQVSRGPAIIAPMPVPPVETMRREPAPTAPADSGPFTLGAAGRGGPRIEEAVPAPSVPPPPQAAPASGLLGGAYRESDGGNEPAPPPPAGSPPQTARSLDGVFNRLAGGARTPDPRDRLRHIPGLGPPSGRPR